ncbi:protein of unknown function [Hymenobacter arizonensis]|uniref:DUF4468 domain-containing protein n=2 Tax=Hymenobacter arizonensis TaxID=1227077 RepID=A0A1I5ZYP8_HYMAR|nr:protein of unknown function [Hymenobacter arizonensis]
MAVVETTPGLPIDPATQRIVLSTVVAVPGATQQQLYDRAAHWIANEAETRPSAFQVYNPTQGKIMVEGIVHANQDYHQDYVSYTLSVYVKEGRYRVVATNLRRHSTPTGTTTGYSGDYVRAPLERNQIVSMSDKQWRNYKLAIAQLLRQNFAQLQATMTSSHKDFSDF